MRKMNQIRLSVLDTRPGQRQLPLWATKLWWNERHKVRLASTLQQWQRDATPNTVLFQMKETSCRKILLLYVRFVCWILKLCLSINFSLQNLQKWNNGTYFGWSSFQWGLEEIWTEIPWRTEPREGGLKVLKVKYYCLRSIDPIVVR